MTHPNFTRKIQEKRDGERERIFFVTDRNKN